MFKLGTEIFFYNSYAVTSVTPFLEEDMYRLEHFIIFIHYITLADNKSPMDSPSSMAGTVNCVSFIADNPIL